MEKATLTPASIRKFRAERGLSQQGLATVLNVGLVTVCRWETGKTKPEGTADAVLAALVSDRTESEPYGPLASGYAIYRLLKSRFEEGAEN